MKRLVVLASGRGSNVLAINRAIENETCRASIEAVISERPNAPVLQQATQLGLRTLCVPFSQANRSAWDTTLTNEVTALSPDLVILAGFMKILSPRFVARFPRRILNIHPSLLPSLPGTHAIERALSEGHAFTGVSIHIVDEGVDTGPLLAQARIAIHASDDEHTLRGRVQAIEHKLYPLVIEHF